MKCQFCGNEIKSGTGIMFIKNDGTIMYFCNSKCKKNFLNLHRDPRKYKWTKYYNPTALHKTKK